MCLLGLGNLSLQWEVCLDRSKEDLPKSLPPPSEFCKHQADSKENTSPHDKRNSERRTVMPKSNINEEGEPNMSENGISPLRTFTVGFLR